jgi:hypothetical protein
MKYLTLFLFIWIASTCSAYATVIYVDSAQAGGTQNGTSWATAFYDLQVGINAATSDDTLWVAKGTYQRAAFTSFSMKQA